MPDAALAGPPRVHVYLQDLASVPSSDDWLDDEERSTLARLRVPKRRAEWRLGRWTAKLALAAFTADEGPWGIRADPDGAPRAVLRGGPAEVVISLSHSAGRGACAVIRSSAPPAPRLGCDVERIEARSGELVDLFFTERERARVAAAGADRARVVTILWSAKESVLKAAREGLRADTRSVEVEFELDEARGVGHVRASKEGRVLVGHVRLLRDGVLTCVSDPPCDQLVVHGA